ncbi:GMC oxidoreductase [Echria macrotheca]|uniref:GMC oxidoreductase n=1 Tax=Echria macrotheca TaxID=438768 RepID=A0AAJ0F8G5_9PEZI|nr:GMC oxidoreductase [Echria macrotheca]
MLSATLIFGALVLPVIAAPSVVFNVKRQVSQLRPSYDFIIAGGGTTGLTVADRLTQAFPKKTVLVVEYGEVEYAPGIFDPPLAVWGGIGASASYFIVQSQPIPDVKNASAFVLAGKVVGGSSAINGQFFDRPSRYDLDSWSSCSGRGRPGQSQWGWDDVYPFFKKSVNFTAPLAAVAQKYNFTWDSSVYGPGPIYSSFPPFLWADHHGVRDAWAEMGIPPRRECAGGDKDALCWIPISQDPVTARRSHAGIGHYTAVNASRPNYDLLVKHQVVRVVYPKGPQRGPPLVEIRSLADSTLRNLTAKAEVVIAAGAFHTPAILQRSGFGKKSILKDAGIDVVVDLPGVGSNFQDHSGSGVSWNYSKPGDWYPLPSAMADPAFLADAVAGFNEIPARGPYTLANSNSAIFVPLRNITTTSQTIIERIRSMIADGSAASYLPADYRSDASMVAGYNEQLSKIADLLSNPHAPSIESTFATGTSLRAVNLHPLSRGTVRLNLTDKLQVPVVQYGTGSNPVDFDIYAAHVKYLQRVTKTTALKQFGAAEVTPGPAVQTDAQLIEYIKSSMVLSFMHPCCTAAMLPRDKGGVVDADLRVHGAAGLRVADMSVLPYLPSSHLSSVAYAVGEKAADILVKTWR